MKCLNILIIIFFLPSCAINSKSHQHYLHKKGLDTQTIKNFQHCHGYGCKFKTSISFADDDWIEIETVFSPMPQTEIEERIAIKQAIAIFEQRIGQKAGTSGDIGGTFKQTGKYQLDCVDESINTTIYLSLLRQKGLLQLHKIEAPNVRLPIVHSGRWPHQTAVISEKTTGNLFVVDSWFHNNGIPPEIVTLKKWKDGWRPED